MDQLKGQIYPREDLLERLLRVHRKDLAAAPFREFVLDLFDESAFFGIQPVFGKVTGVRDNESDIPLEFAIELLPV